jgi:Methyltransferase FkbM domain
VTHVDYFSLEVEGSELDVLKTIDFDKFDITVRTCRWKAPKTVFLTLQMLSVEYRHVKEGKAAVEKFMTSKGYRVDSVVADNNFIFAKHS